VHALAGQGIEVHRQRGHQGLALAGAHLGDLAVVQGHAADQLHVEVAHLEDALAGLAHRGKGFGQQVVQGLALGQRSLNSAVLPFSAASSSAEKVGSSALIRSTTRRYCLSRRSLRCRKSG
jgi:hypothetical protein